MKETCYQAWDTKKKEMIIGDTETAFNLSRSWKRRYILLQYIGLKDKNGKKIFEGYIIKINGWNGKNIVRYYEKWAGFGLDGSDWKTNYIHQRFDDGKLSVEYEIIGNIYENPELLKGGRND